MITWNEYTKCTYSNRENALGNNPSSADQPFLYKTYECNTTTTVDFGTSTIPIQDFALSIGIAVIVWVLLFSIGLNSFKNWFNK